ncbi:GntR family transcriptional regulator [Alkalibacterium iburiense]|uniref:GntR family transcriptional regulator n=1 Tax=Alkalibacterium iburiense TaxID=290589 RepID=UPI003CD079F9
MPQSFDDSKPIYIQVRERLEDMIVKGQLEEGEQAPSTTQLSKFYKINHITVGKGVNQLVDEGVLFKKRGIGMFVSDGAKEKLLENRKKTFVAEYIHPLLVEAEKLGITKEELSNMLKQEKGSE